MIKGRYVKGGNYTEIEIGTGIREIVPEDRPRELQVFTFEKRPPKPHARIAELTTGNLIAVGIAAGGTIASMITLISMTGSMPITQALTAGILVLDSIMLIVNLTKEVKH